jgi:uncharacterized membrane protein (DUF4010 family)
VLASVSFAGFVAIRALGERRGVLVAGAVGGVVSSTAVIFANARDAAAGHGTVRVLAAGTALATAVSFVRVTIVVAALNPALLAITAPPLLFGAVAAVAFAAVAMRWRDGAPGRQSAPEFRNPFGFFAVVGMALSMGLIMLIGRIVSERYGASGATVTAMITGLFDVDAMAVSMTQLAPRVLDTTMASQAILAGVASATLGKVAIGAIIGRGGFALTIGGMSVLCVAVGALAFFGIAALR